MGWFLDMIDPDNAAKNIEAAVSKAPNEALNKAPLQWSKGTVAVVGVTALSAIGILLATSGRKNFAKGAASRGGSDVDRSGLELMFFGQRQAEQAQKTRKEAAAKAAVVKVAEARLEAIKRG